MNTIFAYLFMQAVYVVTECFINLSMPENALKTPITIVDGLAGALSVMMM